MWGNTILSSFTANNSVSFALSNSSIILHIIQWQYWWWFWFSIFFIFYYNIVIKTIFYRSMKFYPKLSTSTRPRGRWGDLLVAVIPIYWCSNILINSNSLLKVIEWQDSSSFITVRVRGKQWYWVYKLSSLSNVSSDKINILLGNNSEFCINNMVGYKKSNNLFDFLLRWNNEFYLRNVDSLGVVDKSNKLSISNTINTVTFGCDNEVLTSLDSSECYYGTMNMHNTEYPYDLQFSMDVWDVIFSDSSFGVRNVVKPDTTLITIGKENEDRTMLFVEHPCGFLGSVDVSVNSIYAIKSQDTLRLVDVMFGESKTQLRKPKYTLTLRQKPVKEWFSYIGGGVNSVSYSFVYEYLNRSKGNYINSYCNSYLLSNNNRLLNTTTLLVLPTGRTISIISNSFDVVHSWFIPGLGLKIDCVPGRSTHHILKIDVPGFYYGQCAEICGRFHHHMPIKVCALVFDHFLIWWQHYFMYLNFTDNWEDSLKISRPKYARMFT